MIARVDGKEVKMRPCDGCGNGIRGVGSSTFPGTCCSSLKGAIVLHKYYRSKASDTKQHSIK